MRSTSLDAWLRGLTSQELTDRLEMYTWARADLEDNKESVPDIYLSGKDYLDYHITSFSNELARRETQRRKYGVNRNLRITDLGRERFDAVKSAVPITTLLFREGFGEPARAGNRQVMSCPLGLHDDSTPSFTIYPGDQGWYCFGCGQGGTVIDLAMHLYKTNSPREALAHLTGISQELFNEERTVRELLTR